MAKAQDLRQDLYEKIFFTHVEITWAFQRYDIVLKGILKNWQSFTKASMII